MRYLLLALMIVLLPLRGWMGDAMATNMAVNAAFGFENTPETIAASTHTASVSGQFSDKLSDKLSHQAAPASSVPTHSDCGGHVSGDAAPAAQVHGAPDEHDKLCHSCQACQACHTVALPPPLQAAKSGFAAPPMLPTAAAQFTSAYTALGQKPPIS